MQRETDPNVVYGGDPTETTGIDKNTNSIGEVILNDFKLGGNQVYLINAITDKKWTFLDLYEQSSMMAKALYGAGLRKNDVVSIVAENRHEFQAAAFGAIVLNAAVAPVNVTYTERELSHALNLSKPKIVFASPYTVKRVVAVCKKLSYVQHVVLFGDKPVDKSTILLDDFVKKYSDTSFDLEKYVKDKVDIREQVSVIVCSSGTTGLPKGVLLTQENMLSVLQSYRDLFSMAKMIYADGGLTVLSVPPWFHAMGFVSMYLAACSRVATYVFLPKFHEEAFLRAIETYKVKKLSIVPPIMVFLAKSPLVDKYDISSIQEIGCGAAALSADTEEQVRQRLGNDVSITQGYGMSETTLGILQTRGIIKPGSVGEPAVGAYAKIVDENGKSLGPNQRGELCFKGDLVMKGYIDDVHSTKDTIDNDGWLHTGDIAYYDEDKQFYIVDRLKELIKYKGFQVPPAEIEGLLLSHSKVKDCGVIGIPDEESGELPLAFVVAQPGATLTEKEVQDFVAENASKAKWLRGGVRFIDEIPKTQSGKLLRREMKEMYLATKPKL